MKSSAPLSFLRWISLILILSAVILTTLELVSYSRIRTNFPSGETIASVPVGSMDRQQAARLLTQTYGVPVEVHYGSNVIQIKPSMAGFELDLDVMLSAADIQRVNQPFWGGFWDHLWNRHPSGAQIPLRATYSEERLRDYLKNEISTRYDQPPTSAEPIPGTANFKPGQPGTYLNIDRAVTLIWDAFRSPGDRVVNLTFDSSSAPRPTLNNLQILLQQIIDISQFKGIVELYMDDLQNAQTIHFAHQAGSPKPLKPDIAFSGWSTIKIPVLISAFRRLGDQPSDTNLSLMKNMIEVSSNESTDSLAQTVIDKNLGPVMVSDDMQTLGLLNTFWGGYFYTGAPLLKMFETPANKRTDINTGPDVYDQTTPEDLGLLLEDIYACATNNGGALIAAFPGQITQEKCKLMIEYLSNNNINQLIQAGVPAGTVVAHKHGWAVETDGMIHTMGNAALIYTPGGNYILSIFVHDDNQVLFNPANQMVAELSRAVYNYFNVPSQ